MTLGEMFIEAKKNNLVDLEMLISFLVFEKKVQSFEDDESSLDRYLLAKHQKKMNGLLNEYKKDKGVQYKPSFYEIKTIKDKVVYVLAYSEEQARGFAKSKGFIANELHIMLHDDLVAVNEYGSKKVELDQYKQIPTIVGRKGV